MLTTGHRLFGTLGLAGVVLLTLGGLGRTWAQAANTDEDIVFFDMSREELAQEPYPIVSASRSAQTREEVSVPVTVITREDIHYSGLTNIPEILAFATGVDVQRFDHNRIAVGVRGIHDFSSDRTLILLNNRNALNPSFGGMEWEKLPVMMEDICTSEHARVKDILAQVKDSAVLTVGECNTFLKAGGAINFLPSAQKGEFEINFAASEQARLIISSKLLRIAKRVIQKNN